MHFNNGPGLPYSVTSTFHPFRKKHVSLPLIFQVYVLIHSVPKGVFVNVKVKREWYLLFFHAYGKSTASPPIHL